MGFILIQQLNFNGKFLNLNVSSRFFLNGFSMLYQLLQLILHSSEGITFDFICFSLDGVKKR